MNIRLALFGLSFCLSACIPSASPLPKGETLVTARYSCEDGKAITARYINTSDPREDMVILKIDGPAYMLHSVISGSGARYATENGLKADHSLIWWIKGSEADIYEMPLDDQARPERDETHLTHCVEVKAGG